MNELNENQKYYLRKIATNRVNAAYFLNSTLPEEGREQFIKEEMEKEAQDFHFEDNFISYLQSQQKALWARVFSKTKTGKYPEANRIMRGLISKVKGWSFYCMDVKQLEEAYNLTNEL